MLTPQVSIFILSYCVSKYTIFEYFHLSLDPRDKLAALIKFQRGVTDIYSLIVRNKPFKWPHFELLFKLFVNFNKKK